MTAKKEEITESEPILIGYNLQAANDLISKVERLLTEAQAVGEILRGKGLSVTKETLFSALTMTTRTQGGGRNAYEVFANCRDLDEEFAKQLAAETNGVQSKIIRDNLTATLKQAETQIKYDILDERNKFSEVEFNKDDVRQYLKVNENGVITLLDDYENIIKERTALKVVSDAQKKAYTDHKAAADAITEFLKNFPKNVWPATLAELGNLFSLDENGEFKPALIDYASYIK